MSNLIGKCVHDVSHMIYCSQRLLYINTDIIYINYWLQWQKTLLLLLCGNIFYHNKVLLVFLIFVFLQ